MLAAIQAFFDKIISVFSTFRVSDFFDILFVTVLIYSVIRIIRETRAFQLIKGILLLLVVYALVNVFNMESSTYILKALFSNGLLILIVLFSPEIRHALEQIGKTDISKLNFFNVVSGQMQAANEAVTLTIEATCKACSQLSDSKTGALLVFEKDVLLGEVITTGTILDADPSVQLIGNIFFPKSPLHDGATVVRKGKIYAAGCILPLTKNNALSSSLGTRHRAALGVSEVSDAVVIVVSEETGIISVAKSGKLRRNLSDGDLRDILTNEFIQVKENEEESKLQKMKRRLKK